MALTIVSSGLSAACLISALRNKLDLFHAFCVAHLLILAIPSSRSIDIPGSSNQLVDRAASNWASRGHFILALPSAANLIGLFILMNDVFGDPANYGAAAECNPQVRLSVLGTAIHSTAGVIPWLASILVLLGTIYALVVAYQQLKLFALMAKAEREALDTLSRYYNLNFVTAAAEVCVVKLGLAEARIFKYAAAILLRLYVIFTVESMFALNHVEKTTVSHTTTPQIIMIVLAILVFLCYLIQPEDWRSVEVPFMETSMEEIAHAYPLCQFWNPCRSHEIRADSC